MGLQARPLLFFGPHLPYECLLSAQAPRFVAVIVAQKTQI